MLIVLSSIITFYCIFSFMLALCLDNTVISSLPRSTLSQPVPSRWAAVLARRPKQAWRKVT